MEAEKKSHYFGTDGIRGPFGEGVLCSEGMISLGKAIAHFLAEEEGEKSIVMGRDTRLSGETLAASFANGFLAEGGFITDVGIAPTPMISFLTKTEDFCLGVVFTASHNPPRDNGVKIFDAEGKKLGMLRIERMEHFFQEEIKKESKNSDLSEFPFLKKNTDLPISYLEFLKSSAENSENLSDRKIVVDCANGATFSIASQLFPSLGIETSFLGNVPNGENINEQCGSLFPEKLYEKSVSEGADLGIAFDGDGDRVIITTQERILLGDEIIYLLAKDLKKKGELNKNQIVVTVNSNMGLIHSLEKQGISVEITGVGDYLVAQRMRQTESSFGGESSGHITFSNYTPTGDGLLAAIQILSRFTKEECFSLGELFRDLQLYPQITNNIRVRKKIPFSDLPDLKALIQNSEEILANQGRLLVRYSGTEQKIRILAEHSDEEIAKRVVKNVSDLVNKILV